MTAMRRPLIRTFTLALLLLGLSGPMALVEGGPSLSKLKKSLARALHNNDETGAQDILRELGKVDSADAAKVIVKATVERRDLKLHDAATEALAAMENKRARAFITKTARSAKQWWVRLLLLDACALSEDAGLEEALYGAVVDKHPLVLRKLASLLFEKRNNKAVSALIAILEKSESIKHEALQRHVLIVLYDLTGKDLEASADWKSWWAANEEGFDFSKVDRKDAKDKKGSTATTVGERIRTRGDEKYITEIAEGDVLVVKGVYDKVEAVLEALKIPFKLLTKEELAKYRLKPTSVLIFNCDEKPVDKNTLQRIQGFVKNGGYVFSSDWELTNVLAKGFSKYVGLKKRIDEDEVDIGPNLDQLGHPYLRDVFGNDPYEPSFNKFRWKIDAASDLPVIVSPKAVLPLVISKEMAKKHSFAAVALTFRYGVGSVLHVLGHFQAQADPAGDGYALQQLLANFIIEKQKFRARQKKRGRKKK